MLFRSFEKYNIEDGHFILKHRISDALKAKVEKKGIKLHETFYKQPITSKNHKLRIFILRKKINVQDLLEGKLPEKSDEIAVDRLFARNNSMKTGDKIKVGGSTRRIIGTDMRKLAKCLKNKAYYIPFALFENIISQRLYTNNHAYFDKIFSVISSF